MTSICFITSPEVPFQCQPSLNLKTQYSADQSLSLSASQALLLTQSACLVVCLWSVAFKWWAPNSQMLLFRSLNKHWIIKVAMCFLLSGVCIKLLISANNRLTFNSQWYKTLNRNTALFYVYHFDYLVQNRLSDLLWEGDLAAVVWFLCMLYDLFTHKHWFYWGVMQTLLVQNGYWAAARRVLLLAEIIKLHNNILLCLSYVNFGLKLHFDVNLLGLFLVLGLILNDALGDKE